MTFARTKEQLEAKEREIATIKKIQKYSKLAIHHKSNFFNMTIT